MIGVVVYLTVVVAYSALLCGHQGEDWPPGWAWRQARARRGRAGGCTASGAPESPSRGSRDAKTPPKPAERRTANPSPQETP